MFDYHRVPVIDPCLIKPEVIPAVGTSFSKAILTLELGTLAGT
jgi:hypothetical protein